MSTETKPFIESSVIIKATAAEVWKALTTAEATRQYMFGCNIESDWTPESPVLWRGNEDGMVYVKGKLVRFEKEKTLEYTVIEPNAPYPDTPENHLHVTYTIAAEPEGTRLDVNHGDFSKVADGEKRYGHTIADGGWNAILAKIKDVVEQSL